MPVALNFGSAASGAGFDVASTVSSILALQRTPETAWAARNTALQAQDTALSSIGSDLSSLSSALSSLTNFDGIFASKQAASSDNGSVAVTNVNSSATIGTHVLTVGRLATTSQQYSSTVAASATVSGTLTLQVGSGSANHLQVASGTTISQLAAQINSSGAGVTATVIRDSNGSRLSLLSGTAGSAGQVTTGGSLADSAGNNIGFTVSQTGGDAQYTLDGVALTSNSNTIGTALDGLSFQLVSPTSSPVSLQVAADTAGISSSLSSFVAAYNAASKALTAQEGKDSSGNAQPLFGSSVLAGVQSALTNAVNFSPKASAGGVSLASLGLSFGTDGTLALDTSTLQSALASSFDAVAATFQASGGFGQNFLAALSGAGTAADGTIALAQKSNSNEEVSLADNKTNLETRLAATQTTLTAQLNAANQILQSIPQQLSEITQMFNAITGYTGK